jgi:hypothetical protein
VGIYINPKFKKSRFKNQVSRKYEAAPANSGQLSAIRKDGTDWIPEQVGNESGGDSFSRCPAMAVIRSSR